MLFTFMNFSLGWQEDILENDQIQLDAMFRRSLMHDITKVGRTAITTGSTRSASFNVSHESLNLTLIAKGHGLHPLVRDQVSREAQVQQLHGGQPVRPQGDGLWAPFPSIRRGGSRGGRGLLRLLET